MINLDFFSDPLTGLVIAEVESPELYDPVVPPDWFGIEVTDDPRYVNQALALETELPPF